MRTLLMLFAAPSFLLPTAAWDYQHPPFARYPARDTVHGAMLPPRIVTTEERRFATLLRRAISVGESVVTGGTEDERRGVNFAGHYVLVQWANGTSCCSVALIDVNTGKVIAPPPLPGRDDDSAFSEPIGEPDLRWLQFATDSRLLGVPNVDDGNTYYYVLEGESWRFLRKQQMPQSSDPTLWRVRPSR